MDEDLNQMSREELIAEVKKLRQGVRQHRDRSRHELCWHHPSIDPVFYCFDERDSELALSVDKCDQNAGLLLSTQLFPARKSTSCPVRSDKCHLMHA